MQGTTTATSTDQSGAFQQSNEGLIIDSGGFQTQSMESVAQVEQASTTGLTYEVPTYQDFMLVFTVIIFLLSLISLGLFMQVFKAKR